ncbi:hypothetical protein BCR36DRAFT_406809 [Piromyces finnis]|uniref:Autophagy-related protein 14 n=1 Tax=Piromyces finnis TaxID=1754191 RepID=A0A1Y1UXZ1_9FUNG|nr:hypothetical protein BCR36DRAFT_406809 [Piromyces finnis]|eukprot:ORX43247.1 hypothetical protein BCR36DRAFT_406809 [Piromyces finnis]
MDKNKIYCQVCKIHNLEFHCSKCVNKTFNLYKSEIHQYDLNMKKIVDNIKKLEKTSKPYQTIKNNLENKINDYELQIQEKQLLIQKKKEDINKKRKEIESKRQALLDLNENFKIKLENYSQTTTKPDNLSNNINNDDDDTNKKNEKNTNDITNKKIKEGINDKKEEEKEENEKIQELETFDYSILESSDHMKKHINTTYLKSFEYLNNKLMCARQILIEELSNIFKLKKITGLSHSGSHYSNTFNANNIPSSGSNKSSFLNNSISQVLYDTTSKIFGNTFETEVELNNNTIYHNSNFNLYEEITPPYHPDDHQNSIKMKTSQKVLPPRVKNSYLYHRNFKKQDDKKYQNISNTYTILGHIFPSINEIWNYSHEYINTTLEYIIQYVILLSYYLDIKLPFSLHYQGIRSYVECHLYNCICYLPLCYSEKTIEEFLTGLSMLFYDIVYLCHTQGVDVKENDVLNILKNIYKCSKSPFLGQTLNVDLQLHQHNINFGKLPNSLYHTNKQNITQHRPFNSESFKRNKSYTSLNNTLGNSFNLRFSEIVKLVFLQANIQIPISNITTATTTTNNSNIPLHTTSIPKSNSNTNINLNGNTSSSSNNEGIKRESHSSLNTHHQNSAMEWNDVDFDIETMKLSDNDDYIAYEKERQLSKDKRNSELFNNTNKKLKSILSINNIIHSDKKESNNSMATTSDITTTNNQNNTHNNTTYLSAINNGSVGNDEWLLDNSVSNNNIFDYENMMGSEEQIRKQRLTEFLNCVFHDYFSNTNTNEWVLINQ